MRGDEEGTTDLLGQGSEREPWRLPRRIAVPVAALLVVVSAGVSGLSWVRHQRDLDGRAARAVALLLAGSSISQDDKGFHFGLANAGPAPVRLLDIAFAGRGYPVGHLDRKVVPGDDVEVTVPQGTRCDPTHPVDLVVHVRTSRGAVVTRTVPLDHDVADQVASSERWRCGTLEPREALFFGPSAAVSRDGTVVVTGVLENQGNRPVTVIALTAGSGLAVSTRLPVTVSATTDGVRIGKTVSFTLRVTDCDAFGRAVGGGIDEQPDTIEAQARSAYGQGPVRLTLSLPADPGTGDPGVLPLPLLARSCPGLVVPTP